MQPRDPYSPPMTLACMRDVGIEAGLGEAGKAVLDLVSSSHRLFRVEAMDGCQPADCLDVPDDDHVPTNDG